MELTTQHLAVASPAVVTGELATNPFSQNIVQLTQAEHIELKWNGNYWKAQHEQLKKKHEALKGAESQWRYTH